MIKGGDAIEVKKHRVQIVAWLLIVVIPKLT